jgi:hypothetical protein
VADASDIRSGLAVFLQKKAATTLKNTLFNAMPTLEFFFALSGDKTGADNLGRPKADVMVSSLKGVSQAQKIKIYAERSYLPLAQITKPSKSEVQAMTDYGSDPTVPSWDTTNRPLERFKQARFSFSRKKMPYKVPHSERRTAIQSARSIPHALKTDNTYGGVDRTRVGQLLLARQLRHVVGRVAWPRHVRGPDQLLQLRPGHDRQGPGRPARGRRQR